MQIKNKPVYVCDIEANGFIDNVTKIHCLGMSYKKVDGTWDVKATTRHQDIKALLEQDCFIVGHNFIQYDIPVIKKVYPDIKVNATIIDSLCISWALYDHRIKHGLADYGEEFGVPKPKVEDWENQPIEVYLNRVIEDCKINTKLWVNQWNLLLELYDSDEDAILKYLKYLEMMADVYVEQYENPFTLDVEKAEKNKTTLENFIEQRCSVLRQYMPKRPVYAVKNRPKKCYKGDGTLSALGAKWFDFLKVMNLPEDHNEPVKYIRSYDEPNPQSIAQVKDWLFSIGWQPCTFSESINVKGDVNLVPQIKDKDKNLVKSIKDMMEDHPYLKELEDLSVIQHRLGYVKAFLDTQKNGKVAATMSKFTASTRIAHRKPVVNLPGVTAPYGEYVRPLLTCDEGYILYGSDISSLENYAAANYTYTYNPVILDQLNDPDFDSHTTMAVFSGMMTEEDKIWYQENKKSKLPEDQPRIKKLFKIRYNAKTTNYSALYGIGATKLAKDLGIKVSEAKKLIDGFWKMNFHIKEFIKNDIEHRVTLDGRKWVKAPLTEFWLPCRAEHKIFNIIVQSTGSYIHNLWLYFMRQKGYKMTLSMHDEFVCILPEDCDREKVLQDGTDAMNQINDIFNFPARIKVDGQFGKNYGEIH